MPSDADNKLIYFFQGDIQSARELAAQMNLFGYTAHVATDPAELENRALANPPAAIILDEYALRADRHQALERMQRMRDRPIPLVFTCGRGDMTTRLEAVRAGAAAFLVRPVDVNELIDRLDQLTVRQAPDPFRILIVDHSPQSAAATAAPLEAAGMQTQIVTQPLHVFQPLYDFDPDLILIDMYLPQCTALELAQIIRQQRDFVSIPIVYIAAAPSNDKQLAAMRLGGDDFLTRPIQAPLLVSSVIARSQRSRRLRAFMVRDSLTKLLNHTAIQERLNLEIARARRDRGTVAYGMLDLDHFKAVNDTHGHAAGDAVLKSVARVLQQRLRKTDAVGRYGGEEFAVILPNTSGENARRVMDAIRVGFGQLRHRYDEAEFSVTFSCGLATYPQYAEGGPLSEAADKALYEAKAQGRNRVVLAGGTGPQEQEETL